MIVIVKYNAGNITSVKYALERLGYSSIVSDDIETIKKADKVIFPGVGEASTSMRYLKERQLDAVIKSLTQPVLGICLGMQLMCSHSEENNTPCINIFDNKIKLFPKTDIVPHMGWNNLFHTRGSLFNNLPTDNNVYFVHSYYAEVSDNTTAVVDYIQPFSAAIQKDNFYGVQFHPEKSGKVGSQILNNFLSI